MRGQPPNTTRSEQTGMTAKFMLVTPDQAQQWLEQNNKNRPLSERKVREWTDDMKNGRWDPNPQVIIRDINGDLIDGQHRLWAVWESQTIIEFLVVENAPLNTRDVVDTGIIRTTAHMLTMHQVTQGTRVASIARVALMYDRYPDRLWNQDVFFSKKQILEYALRNQDMMMTAAKAHDQFYVDHVMTVPPRIIGATVFAILTRSNRVALLEDFAKGCGTGIGLQRGDPRLTLRRYGRTAATIIPGGQRGEQVGMAITLKAWNAFAQNRKLVNLRWHPSELPMPKVV